MDQSFNTCAIHFQFFVELTFKIEIFILKFDANISYIIYHSISFSVHF